MPDEAGKSAEVIKRVYLDEEVDHIYELGRFCLENGDLQAAQVIMEGLVEVAPDFVPAWLALGCLQVFAKDYESAARTISQAVRIEPQSSVAMLLLASCLLTTGDFNSAGTYLGEVSEQVESGLVEDPHVVRFFNTQISRYQNR